MTGLVERAIDVAFTLDASSYPAGQANFGDANSSNMLTLSGLRMYVDIDVAGGPGTSSATVRIFGMTADQMNKLSQLGLPGYTFKRNRLAILAGDPDSKSLVYTGQFYDAFQDFSGMPDVAFVIVSHPGIDTALQPVAPTSYAGPVDPVTVLTNLAGQMGRSLENSGVSGGILSNPYYPGSLKQQVEKCCAAAGINYLLEGDDPGVLAIWPKTGSRGGAIPLVSPATGLVGYPTYAYGFTALKTLFNPQLRMGGQLQLKSSIISACGVWYIRKLSHEIDSQAVNGRWFTNILASRV